MANDNNLKKIKDEFTIISLLSSAKEDSSEVLLWRLVGGEKYLASVRIESIRKARKDFCIVPIEGQAEKVQDLIGSQGKVDLYIPESALLLRCNVRQTNAPVRYYLELPEFIAQVERRKSFRLNVYESSEVGLKFSKSIALPRTINQQFQKNCFDISTGGFSFYVSRMESKFFKINDPIRGIELKAGEWSTKVNAEIALIKEVDPDEGNGLPYKVWRVCCRISQIDDISRKYLERFIFERIKDELHAINE